MRFCVGYDIHPHIDGDDALYHRVYNALSEIVVDVIEFLHAFTLSEEELQLALETTYIIHCDYDTATLVLDAIKNQIEDSLIHNAKYRWIVSKKISFTIDILTVSIDGTDFIKGEFSL